MKLEHAENAEGALAEREMARAWERRDPGYDGLFVVAVKTTGIFCRPSCPSQPKRENLEFFGGPGKAVQAGYRPCKRCQPELANGRPPDWAEALMARAAENPDTRISAAELRTLGVPPEKARRWFQANYGMTFAAWCRGLRLARAFRQLRAGERMDEVMLGHGYESHSGFRSAFARVFGQTPGKSAKGEDADCLHAELIETPLGPMLAAADGKAVCQLEFADRRALERSYAELRRKFALPVVPGPNRILEQLRRELGEYFAGKRKEFTVPVAQHGSDFQKRAWRELRRIPYGSSASYEEIARRIGAPGAVRAVARANATNPIYLLVPCHRVIGKNGGLSGYGGGVWRKRLLLDLERSRPSR